MKILFTAMLILVGFTAVSQAKLVINGGIITINNGAILVIDNPDNTAIIQTGSGYIVSEGKDNRVTWSVGAGNTHTYMLPFGNASGYLPVSFSAASGSVNGRMTFSTYPTPTWKNSDYLPTGVTNVNGRAGDNSAKVIDRFWQINPQGYSTKPALSNIIFTYSDAEYNAPNSISEANLVPQRWNNASLTWSDYFPAAVINTSANTITIASVPGNQLYDWWTLVDASSPLPVTLINFRAVPVDKKVITSWQTASESNSSYFEVWRGKDALQFDAIGKLAAAGNSSSLLNYSFTDNDPYDGLSYYRLKMVDKDGKFEWSAIVNVVIGNKPAISLYPNPAGSIFTISVSTAIVDKKPTALIYDATGLLVRSFAITQSSQQVNIASLSSGTYLVKLVYGKEIQILPLIKNN